MPIPRLTPRAIALRDRRKRKPEWKYNPANPGVRRHVRSWRKPTQHSKAHLDEGPSAARMRGL
jgi:hypothetical protein